MYKINYSFTHFSNDFFTLCWKIGVPRKKCLHKSDYNMIESVNIAKTCEIISAALLRNANSVSDDEYLKYFQQFESHILIAARNLGNIPLRRVSNLLYGTVRIYEIQIDNLFVKSKDLMRKSKTDFKNMILGKRKRAECVSVNDGISKHVKKVKLTDKISEINFTNMLDELEQLNKWAREVNFEEEMEKVVLNSRKSINVMAVHNITIAEEINDITSMDLEEICNVDFSFDNVYDPVEFQEFFMQHKLQKETIKSEKRISPKRKSPVYIQEPVQKISRINEESPIAVDYIETTGDRQITILNDEQPKITIKKKKKILRQNSKSLSHKVMRAQLKDNWIYTRKSAINKLSFPNRKTVKILSFSPSRGCFSHLFVKRKRMPYEKLKRKECLDILEDILGYRNMQIVDEICSHLNINNNAKEFNKNIAGHNESLDGTNCMGMNEDHESSINEFDEEMSHDDPEIIEWNESGVLNKLSILHKTLNDNDEKEIIISSLISSELTRKAAAVAFTSIIGLAAKRTITITKVENSAYVQGVKVHMYDNVLT